jgi:hypothetical protein
VAGLAAVEFLVRTLGTDLARLGRSLYAAEVRPAWRRQRTA